MTENAIARGLTSENYPDEYRGGIGDAGFENLKKYVDRGGKLICWDAPATMVIKQFDLPMKNVLTGIRRSEFYNPGSIVRLTSIKIESASKGLPQTPPPILSIVRHMKSRIRRMSIRLHSTPNKTPSSRAGCSAKNISTARPLLPRRITAKARSSFSAFVPSTEAKPGEHSNSSLTPSRDSHAGSPSGLGGVSRFIGTCGSLSCVFV